LQVVQEAEKPLWKVSEAHRDFQLCILHILPHGILGRAFLGRKARQGTPLCPRSRWDTLEAEAMKSKQGRHVSIIEFL